MIVGAVLFGVFGYLVLRNVAAAVPFALVGAVLGWLFTRSSMPQDSDHRG